MICQNLQHDMECPGTGSHCHSAEAVPRRDVKTAPATVAEALQVPEVKALVEAAKTFRDAMLTARGVLVKPNEWVAFLDALAALDQSEARHD